MSRTSARPIPIVAGVAAGRARALTSPLAALVLAACSMSIGEPLRPPAYSSYSVGMAVYSAEGDATRHLLAVGDTGLATLTAWEYWSGQGCLTTCEDGADGEFASSDGSVVAPARQAFHGFTQLRLLGTAPGSTVVTATSHGQNVYDRIDVVPSPLPVDSIRVRGAPFLPDSSFAAVTDAAGNVDSVTLPYRASTPAAWNYASAWLRILAFRNGDSTVYLPMTASSSDSTVVSAIGQCRFAMASCSSLGWITIIGLAPGTETVTVSARSRQFSFVVTVR